MDSHAQNNVQASASGSPLSQANQPVAAASQTAPAVATGSSNNRPATASPSTQHIKTQKAKALAEKLVAQGVTRITTPEDKCAACRRLGTDCVIKNRGEKSGVMSCARCILAKEACDFACLAAAQRLERDPKVSQLAATAARGKPCGDCLAEAAGLGVEETVVVCRCGSHPCERCVEELGGDAARQACKIPKPGHEGKLGAACNRCLFGREPTGCDSACAWERLRVQDKDYGKDPVRVCRQCKSGVEELPCRVAKKWNMFGGACGTCVGMGLANGCSISARAETAARMRAAQARRAAKEATRQVQGTASQPSPDA
ncbi:hypothetical protein OQA88_6956 [Cercophora sp. LCS_1]